MRARYKLSGRKLENPLLQEKVTSEDPPGTTISRSHDLWYLWIRGEEGQVGSRGGVDREAIEGATPAGSGGVAPSAARRPQKPARVACTSWRTVMASCLVPCPDRNQGIRWQLRFCLGSAIPSVTQNSPFLASFSSHLQVGCGAFREKEIRVFAKICGRFKHFDAAP